MGITNYRDLVAWQKSMDLVEAVYTETKGFPKEEMYGLTSQIRRSATSVPSNIAEGQGRRSTPEFCRFLGIAHGSLRELETQILIAGRLTFLTKAQVEKLMSRAEEVGRVITGLLNALRKR